ncbi:MAG: hypothetical protein OEX07_03410 [Gammaproteobacteria bacterium]|nr:hypothetical protein [Gammaproteobacteria bacterium]
MQKIKNIIFYIGMSTLFTHELDALINHEWRLLPFIGLLSDEYGEMAFIFIHIPLFAILIALVASSNDKVRTRSRVGISVFLVIHGLLHVLFMGNVSYEFASTLSNVLIFGGAIFGAVFLLLDFIDKRSNNI